MCMCARERDDVGDVDEFDDVVVLILVLICQVSALISQTSFCRTHRYVHVSNVTTH